MLILHCNQNYRMEAACKSAQVKGLPSLIESNEMNWSKPDSIRFDSKYLNKG